ncbi:MAG: M48 family metalloprotease, partial [Nanoarchaeota archaeon]|nr:M48 family metalloprotease [Nanoarchaeota archaeon]
MSAKKIKYPYEFDPKKRKLAKVYTNVKIINSVINSIIIPIGFLALFIVFGGHVWLWDIVTAVSPDILIYTPLYAFILAIFLMIVQFPLGFYSSFVYEHKYNLSNYKLKGWFVDFLKETLISLIFFIPAITVLYYLIIFTPLWWLYAGIIYAVVATILDFMLPVILLPFFYKIEPYKNEKQKKKLLDMVRRAGISNIKTVLVANESEKSKKPNAMFAGFGHTKRIVLFDTLINY